VWPLSKAGPAQCKIVDGLDFRRVAGSLDGIPLSLSMVLSEAYSSQSAKGSLAARTAENAIGCVLIFRKRTKRSSNALARFLQGNKNIRKMLKNMFCAHAETLLTSNLSASSGSALHYINQANDVIVANVLPFVIVFVLREPVFEFLQLGESLVQAPL